jgi:Protein of unknown function (DUF1203)
MPDFRILGLDPEPVRHLYGLSDADLRAAGAIRYEVDAVPGYPDRIGLSDVPLGERVLLVNYVHHPAANPYRASHAVYVREGATERAEFFDEIPEALRVRLLSLRAFDADDMMIDADVLPGTEADQLVRRFFERPAVAYVHAHFAKRGCFAARIDRV